MAMKRGSVSADFQQAFTWPPVTALPTLGCSAKTGATGTSPSNMTCVRKDTPPETHTRPAMAFPAPVKFYGFPNQVSGYYQNMGFASVFALALEEALARVYYYWSAA